jgi:hypothetical protein
MAENSSETVPPATGEASLLAFAKTACRGYTA